MGARRTDLLAALITARYINFHQDRDAESVTASGFLIDWWKEPEPEGGAPIDQQLLAQKLLMQFGIAPQIRPMKESNGK